MSLNSIGKTWPELSKRKASIDRSGKCNNMFGKKHTEESKRKMSKIKKIQNAGKNNPMYGKHYKVQCPHCQKIGNYMVMPRWHFDNCKERLK